MGMVDINFLALPLTALAALLVSPLAFRRAGFPWGKTAFGTVAMVFGSLALVGMVISVQHKAGLMELPLAWGMLPVLALVLYRISLFKDA